MLTRGPMASARRGNEGLIGLKQLEKDIRTLVTLKETNQLVLSCYLNLQEGENSYRDTLDERVQLLRKSLRGEIWGGIEEALIRAEAFLETQLLIDTKGVAIFARGGDHRFFLPFQFRVPLPNWIVVDSMPNVYHLVELKEPYHRYLVLIVTKGGARILEVNLGSVIEQARRGTLELKKPLGREWTRQCYQNHRKEFTDQFIKEVVKVLKHLLSADGYSHFIIAGDLRMASRVKRELPRPLSGKLIDTLTSLENYKLKDLVSATIDSFVQQEEKESQATVTRLQQEINTNGLAVVGTARTLDALARGQADVLLMTTGYSPEPGWQCPVCEVTELNLLRPFACPYCEGGEMREVNTKEEMVRIAERSRCQIEIVNESEVLSRFGGVGCLLRYRKSPFLLS